MLKVVIGSYRVFAAGFLFMVFGLGALFLSSVVFTFIKIFIKDRRKRTLYSRAFTSNSFKLYLISGTVLGIFRIRFNNYWSVFYCRCDQYIIKKAWMIGNKYHAFIIIDYIKVVKSDSEYTKNSSWYKIELKRVWCKSSWI